MKETGVVSARRPLLGISWQGPAFAALGLLLGVGLVSFSQAVYVVQGNMAALAGALPLGYAFAAGMVATVNPCGVLLLPSLVAYYLAQGEEEGLTAGQKVGRALLLSLMATLGFVALFGVIGGVVAAGGRAVASYFPAGGLAVGIGLTALGLWLALTGRSFGLLAAGRAMGQVELGGDLRSLFVFGVAYGVASLACTLPIFLVIAGTALAAASPLQAAGQFVGYALGMGTVLSAVVLGAAFFQAAISRWVRRVAPYVHRLAASFLLGAGVFVSWYWLTTGQLMRV